MKEQKLSYKGSWLCVCVHVYPCVHVCAHMCIFMWVRVCLCVCMRVCARACMHLCVRAREFVCVHMCACISVYVHVSSCVCACVCVHVSLCVRVHMCVRVCARAWWWLMLYRCACVWRSEDTLGHYISSTISLSCPPLSGDLEFDKKAVCLSVCWAPGICLFLPSNAGIAKCIPPNTLVASEDQTQMPVLMRWTPN